MARAALAGGLLVLLAGAVAVVLPFLARERTLLAETPQPRPLTEQELIVLPAGARACLDEAVLDEHAERALIRVGTYGAPPSPLRMEITGPGLHAVARIAGYSDSAETSVPVDPPGRAVAAEVCIANEGSRRVALYAGADRRSRSTTRVDGARVDGNFELAFAEAEPATLAERLGWVVERMQAFRPHASWLTWVVALLFLVGVPVGAVWACAASYPRRP